MTVDPEQLRTCAGYFATGVTVVSLAVGEALHGATVNAFTTVSLNPPLVLISLNRTSKAARLLPGRPFTVNVLAAEQHDLALRFAGRAETAPDVPPWQAPPERLAPHTAPALGGSLATFFCTPWASHDGGDHLLFLGRVEHTARRPGAQPLLYYRSAFHSVLARGSYETDGSA
ncbi:flavin reductase [Streptomyces sp. p1417]|uniref:Flavin reductase n=1 Tax=Streptomyces typhae TaxID=2681492 RepID=A0A6L6X4P0_9ACTN|nr:flavin reductase [Streptomyces typhae]